MIGAPSHPHGVAGHTLENYRRVLKHHHHDPPSQTLGRRDKRMSICVCGGFACSGFVCGGVLSCAHRKRMSHLRFVHSCNPYSMVHMVLNHNLLSLLCQQNHADVSSNGLPMIKGARARTLAAPHKHAITMRTLGV